MKNSKKIFLAAFALFMIILVIVMVDISKRTTFPGSKPQLKERMLNSKKQKVATDSINEKSSSTTEDYAEGEED
jgi:hypothetical protein